MRKNKVIRFFREKIAYFVIGAGAFALIASVGVYQHQMNGSSNHQQHIDLNEPAVAKEESTAINANSNEVAGSTQTIPPATIIEKKEEVIEEVKEKTTQTQAKVYRLDKNKKMSWPIVGNVLLPFSMDTTIYFETLDQYKCNPGIFIQSPENATVSASVAGKVTNIEKTEYGNTLTLEIGEGYEMIYGQLKDIRVKVGDTVEEKEILGKVAKPSQFYSLEGTHLYFQINEKGKPVNPMKYLE